MPKQMNQYSLVFNRESSVRDEQGQEYNAAFQAAAQAIAVTSWMIANKIDFIGPVTPKPADETPRVTVYATAEAATQLAGAFPGQIAAVELEKENIITIPDPYLKKTRRPGFEA